MHNFMQFCDYENAELDVRAEAKRLAELGFISRAQEELLSPDELEGFFKSELYKKMKRARRIYREQRYNLSQSASKYYESDAAKGQTLLIQGVIDCFFEDENGDMILVDFKTDRVPREGGEQILRERHTPQLLLYAEAVELMLTKKLSRAYVYSFALGREIVCIEGGAYAT
jgi:ATP-dependent helicase/nuclease subunit A